MFSCSSIVNLLYMFCNPWCVFLNRMLMFSVVHIGLANARQYLGLELSTTNWGEVNKIEHIKENNECMLSAFMKWLPLQSNCVPKLECMISLNNINLMGLPPLLTKIWLSFLPGFSFSSKKLMPQESDVRVFEHVLGELFHEALVESFLAILEWEQRLCHV